MKRTMWLYNERPEIDRWILSELTFFNKRGRCKFYADYEPTRAGRAISDFTPNI